MILYQFRKQIEDIINNSGMSIDAVYYILKDVMNEVTTVYNIEIEKEELKRQEEKEQDELDKE